MVSVNKTLVYDVYFKYKVCFNCLSRTLIQLVAIYDFVVVTMCIEVNKPEMQMYDLGKMK